jgi:hypothetical protein
MDKKSCRKRLSHGDSQNEFEIIENAEPLHASCALNIYPDGGVARLRVHGEVVPDRGKSTSVRKERDRPRCHCKRRPGPRRQRRILQRAASPLDAGPRAKYGRRLGNAPPPRRRPRLGRRQARHHRRNSPRRSGHLAFQRKFPGKLLDRDHHVSRRQKSGQRASVGNSPAAHEAPRKRQASLSQRASSCRAGIASSANHFPGWRRKPLACLGRPGGIRAPR